MKFKTWFWEEISIPDEGLNLLFGTKTDENLFWRTNHPPTHPAECPRRVW